MLPGHHLHAHVAANHQQAVVRHEASQAEECRLQVLLVAAEIDESDGVLGLLHHLDPALGVIARCAEHLLPGICIND